MKYSFIFVVIFFVGLVSIFLLFSSNFHDHSDAYKTETIHAEVTITKIDNGKNTIVYGRFQYTGKAYQIMSTDGYYYKKYNLVVGQKIPCDVVLYYYNDGFIEIGEMNLDQHQIKP